MDDYFVCSSKDWHRDGVGRIAQELPQHNWIFIASPQELDSVIAQFIPKRIFFLHWNWIVPNRIVNSFECVCFHMTDLPYGRGGSPLQNLILAGKSETKVSAIRMTEGIDTGPVYCKRDVDLSGRAEEIYARVGAACWMMVKWIIETNPMPTAQEGQATLFRRRTPSQSSLPSAGTLSNIFDFIRMLDAPTYPLAFLEHGEFRLEFSHAELTSDEVLARVSIRRTNGAES